MLHLMLVLEICPGRSLVKLVIKKQLVAACLGHCCWQSYHVVLDLQMRRPSLRLSVQLKLVLKPLQSKDSELLPWPRSSSRVLQQVRTFFHHRSSFARRCTHILWQRLNDASSLENTGFHLSIAHLDYLSIFSFAVSSSVVLEQLDIICRL